jgi:hypothetical protein
LCLIQVTFLSNAGSIPDPASPNLHQKPAAEIAAGFRLVTVLAAETQRGNDSGEAELMLPMQLFSEKL